MRGTNTVQRALVLALLLLALAPSAALACTPIGVTWFREQVTIQNAALPPDVKVRVGTNKDTIEIANSSQTPLYLLMTSNLRTDAYEPLSLPAEITTRPVNKVVAGQAYGWEPADNRRTNAQGAWVQGFYTNTLVLRLTNDQIASDEGHIALQPSNKLSSEPRPKGVAVPSSQQVDLQLVYGERLITVPITISYVLNPDYDPDRYADFSCSAVDVDLFRIPCIIVIALALIGFVLTLRNANPQLGKPRL